MENITVNGFNIRIDRISSLGEVGWGDFWVIPMTVEGFMGTLYYGAYSKDEVREIYESKGIGLI